METMNEKKIHLKLILTYFPLSSIRTIQGDRYSDHANNDRNEFLFFFFFPFPFNSQTRRVCSKHFMFIGILFDFNLLVACNKFRP